MAAVLSPRLAHDLLASLISGPWAISSREFVALQSRLSVALTAGPDAFLSLDDLFTARPGLSLDDNGLATIHVQGALADKAPPIWEKLGQTDYRSIRSDLASARAAGAEAIHLAIDSPGGMVAGVEETAQDIQAVAEFLPVTAHCDGLACSAAYWLAASADTITATPSATVGNIGTVLAFADISGFLEAQGIELVVMTNEGADLKGTFRESLTDSQRDFLQADLDATGATFRTHVEGNRPAVDPEVFRAGWYSGESALSMGLVDTITTSQPNH